MAQELSLSLPVFTVALTTLSPQLPSVTWAVLCRTERAHKPTGPPWRSRYGDLLRTGQSGGPSSSLARVKNFHSSLPSRPARGGGSAPGREVDQSPTKAEVRKAWILTSVPPYVSSGLLLN
jgi:hypothetical protein